ncbi:hypothetical protein P3S68_008193 [Capsicum galapagoense]
MGHQLLKLKLTHIWKPSEEVNLVDLGSDYFLIKFLNEQNMLHVLHNGPWFILNSHLSIQRWEPKFVASQAKVAYTAIWLWLSELPSEFYDWDVLQKELPLHKAPYSSQSFRPFSSLTASNTNGEHCPDGERLSQPSSIRLDEPSSSSTTELVAGNRVDGSCVNLQLAYQRGAGTDYDSASGRISSDNSERYEIGPGCFQSPPLVSNPTALSTTDRQLEGVSLLSTATTWAGSLDPTAYHNAVNNGEFHEHAATIPSGRPISDPTSASGRIDRNRGRRAQLSTRGSPSRTGTSSGYWIDQLWPISTESRTD